MDYNSRDALSFACEKGACATVQALLCAKADVQWAMDSAVRPGNVLALQLLLKGKADVHYHPWSWPTALCGAASYYTNSSVLARANEGVLRLLLRARASVNFGGNGRTPLHMSVLTNNERVLKLLLQAKADANLTDAFNRTPLAVALDRGFGTIANLLRSHTRT